MEVILAMFSTRFNKTTCFEDFADILFISPDKSKYVTFAERASKCDSEFSLIALHKEKEELRQEEMMSLLRDIDTMLEDLDKPSPAPPGGGFSSFEVAYAYGIARNPLVFSGLIPFHWLLRNDSEAAEFAAAHLELNEWLLTDLAKSNWITVRINLARRSQLPVSVAQKILAGCVTGDEEFVLEALINNDSLPEALRVEAALRRPTISRDYV